MTSLPLSPRAELAGQLAALARLTSIAPRELAGLTMEEYSSSGLADDVLAHMERIVLAEQQEQQKKSGTRGPVARKRPAFKKRAVDA